MGFLYHIDGGGPALCPFARLSCESKKTTDMQCSDMCAWVIPYRDENLSIEYFTCAMNDTLIAAMVRREEVE